jgi:hypothetical protein
MSLQTVHIRVNGATGRPEPVRIRITDATGNYFAPFGHAAEFPSGRYEAVGGDVIIDGKRWAYIDGACEVALPPGELTVEIHKGPEFESIRDAVSLPAGKLALRFKIVRRWLLREMGWWSGDIRSHALTVDSALLETRAEDLAVTFLLAHEQQFASADGRIYTTFPNLTAFSGQRVTAQSGEHNICLGTLNHHPVLGTLGLLHCHRVVYPLSFGGPDGNDDWSLADWCGQCHRKKGLVVWVDAFDPKIGHAGEALADLILGHIDAVEVTPESTSRVGAWYQLLNAGLRIPLVGASGKDRNCIPLGALRTYARVEPDRPFVPADWIEGVRLGKSNITSGPSLRLCVEGMDPGALIRRPADATRLRVQFGASGLGIGDSVELVANGVVVARDERGDEFDFDLPTGGWVAARALHGDGLLAHSSPVYIEVDGVPPPIDPAAVAFLDGHLQRTRAWIITEGRFTKPKSRDHLLSIIDAARQKLLARTGGSATIAP